MAAINEQEVMEIMQSTTDGYTVSLEKVYTVLDNIAFYNDYLTNSETRKKFLKDNVRDGKILLLDESKDENDKDKDFIMRKIKNINNEEINVPYFSTDGFKMFYLSVGEPNANFIRKYFINSEKNYMRLLQQSHEECKKK